MKINWNLIMTLLFGLFVTIIIFFCLYGCERTKTITKTDTKYIRDTLIVNGDTIIRNIEVKQDCPECKPKTRFETRLEYRLDKRKLKALQSMYKDSLKEARKINASNNDRVKYVTKWKTKEVVKVAKSENKSNWLLFIVIGFVIGILTLIIWKK